MGVFFNEEAPKSIALIRASNLVVLADAPDEKSLPQTSPSEKSLSRNQRCFSQFNRILSHNKASKVSFDVWHIAPSPMGVCRIDWAVQLTQTRLYRRDYVPHLLY